MSKKKKKKKSSQSRKKQNHSTPAAETINISQEESSPVTSSEKAPEPTKVETKASSPSEPSASPASEPKSNNRAGGSRSPELNPDGEIDSLEASVSPPLPPSAPIGWKQWWNKGTDWGDVFVQLLVVFVAGAVLLPNSNFGLWDCWEPQYAETARMMILRKDWAHPYWSYAFLLSKPILMFWYMAASMSIFGVHEWAIRLPFTLHAIFLLWSVYFTISRLFSRRAGLLAAVAVGTAPLTVFLGKQALADILAVSYLTSGLGFFALAVFGPKEERERARKEGVLPSVHIPYLMVFYALMGLTLLAKGLMGIAVAGVTVVGYMLLTFDFHLLARIRLLMGILVASVIALPWYIHMCFFPGRNIDDGYNFVKRFIINDNFKRVFGGVHGDRGHVTYMIRQWSYAMGMWVGFMPMALFSFGRFRRGVQDPDERLQRFLFSWWIFSFLLFAFSSTKFHHYIYPVIPISGILIGIWVDRFLSKENNGRYRYALLLVVAVFALVFQDLIRNPHHLVNLFVYKYSRPYPWADQPVLWGLEWHWRAKWFVSYFKATPPVVLRFFVSVVAALFVGGYLFNLRKYVIYGLVLVSIPFSMYLSSSFMPDLSRHWSQRPLFNAVKKDSKLWRTKLLGNPWRDARKHPIPKQPLIAFRMRWRGEKFYSLNHDLQLLGTDSYMRTFATIERYRRKGQPMYFLIERSRLKRLKRAIGVQDSARLDELKSVYKKTYLMDWFQKKMWFQNLKKRLGIRENCMTKKTRKYRRYVKIGNKRFVFCRSQKNAPHNKYMMLKLRARPANFKLNAHQLKRDNRNRKYYDDYARNWRKKQRKKRRKKR